MFFNPFFDEKSIFINLSTITNNNDWDSEIVNLNNYIGQDDVLIKFRNVNQYENNLYIDNINIQGNTTTSINDISIEHIVYPNPTNNFIDIVIKTPRFNNVELYVSNVLGKRVYKEMITVDNQSSIRVSLQGLSEGVYFVNILTSTGELYTKQVSYIK